MAIKISTQFIRKKRGGGDYPHVFFNTGICKKCIEEAWSGLLWLRIGTGVFE